MKYALIVIILALLVLFIKCTPLWNDSQDNGGDSISNFSLIDYSIDKGNLISETSAHQDEKLVCKIIKDGKMVMQHNNVVFDSDAIINVNVEISDSVITLFESGNYGHSGVYRYYNVNAKVGDLSDGDYTIVVKRNGNIRAMFKFTYDSSKAKM